MIEYFQYTEIHCDSCGELYSAHVEPTYCKEWARIAGWSIGREKHYCSGCRPRFKPFVFVSSDVPETSAFPMGNEGVMRNDI